MKLEIELYERTVVFVQRLKENSAIEPFAKYADLNQIVKDKLIPQIPFDDIQFPDNSGPFVKSISFPKLNFTVSGQPERLVISMINANGEEESFYAASKKYSDVLVKEDISAVGVNFNGIIRTKYADELIKSKILDGSTSILSEADTAAFRLIHKEKDKKAIFIINIESGELVRRGEEEKGILISCNYHRDIKNRNLVKQKIEEFQSSMVGVKSNFEKHKNRLEELFND